MSLSQTLFAVVVGDTEVCVFQSQFLSLSLPLLLRSPLLTLPPSESQSARRCKRESKHSEAETESRKRSVNQTEGGNKRNYRLSEARRGLDECSSSWLKLSSLTPLWTSVWAEWISFRSNSHREGEAAVDECCSFWIISKTDTVTMNGNGNTEKGRW